MIICGNYMVEFNASKNMKKKDTRKEVTVGKVAAHLCLTLVVQRVEN